MAYFSGSAAEYDFDRFDIHEKTSEHTASQSTGRTRGSVAGTSRAAAAHAPAKKVQSPKKADNLKKVPPKSQKQKNKENRISFRRSLVIGVSAAVLLFGVAGQIAVGAEKYRLSRRIAATEARLEVEKSENIRLNAELNGITGIGKIDEYAEKVLGMAKAESYQVECIDLSEGDAVLFTRNQLF